MTGNRAIRLLLLLGCFAAPGCASVPRSAPQVANEAQPADDDHAELERELNLYSD